ncbi:MAG TPA: hypothetical protein P5526_13815 [Anaerolineae bacterium]|nr:hypothetical protein [Anaerolineae bacterium]MCB9104014.1 hypothetical protein [Anaerolineales bacterium]HRV93233.1 hypothetical protein [Anaerolineae bacterium]
MLLMLGLGIVIGILVVVAVVKATMRTEPTGCILVFGSIIFILVWLVIVILWLVRGG